MDMDRTGLYRVAGDGGLSPVATARSAGETPTPADWGNLRDRVGWAFVVAIIPFLYLYDWFSERGMDEATSLCLTLCVMIPVGTGAVFALVVLLHHPLFQFLLGLAAILAVAHTIQHIRRRLHDQ